MNRGIVLRHMAAVCALVTLAALAAPPVSAAGNAHLFLHKTVDPAQVSINPNIGVSLAVDKTTAIPADRLTYTAVVTNPTATMGMGGNIDAQTDPNTDGVVVYYWDELEVCAIDCGNALADPNWKAVATFEAAQPGYQPIEPPALHTGMSFAAQPVVRSGVIYPTSGDPVLGTQISAASTATWTYTARVVLAPTQIAVLADPTQVIAMRNVIHFEVTPRNSSAAQPFTDLELFTNPFTTSPSPGAIANVTVTFTLPDGTTTNVPATSSLAPGASATATAQFKVPVPTARVPGETEPAYVMRLHQLDGSALTASAVATGAGFSGTVYATSSPVTTNEFVPIVTIAKSGPGTVDAGTTETNPLALQNIGGATASGLTLTDTVPSGGNASVSGTPGSIAAGATASATASFAVPISQATGTLTDTASVTWQDANGNPYGSLTSSFTTQVHNVLFGATLTLAPATAGPNQPGTQQTLTATLRDAHGNPIPGQVVQFAVTGANTATGSATTDVNGVATFSYTGANSGNDSAQATVSAPGITINSNTSAISWLKLLQPVAMGAVQGNFFANPSNSCSFDIGPTATPLWGQTFPNIMFNPDPAIFKFPPPFIRPDSNGVVFNNSTRPFTDITTDVNGNPNGQIVAQGNGLQAGAGNLLNFYAVFSGSFVVGQPGDLTFRILHDDGYIIGVGGGATRVNGDLEGTVPATTPFQGYPVVGAFNFGSTGSSSSGPVTVHFPAAGTYPFELDYTECAFGPLFLDLLTESFIPQTSSLAVFVGYADGLRGGGSAFPFPWNGSPNTNFQGCTTCVFDAGALRFDNNSQSPITFDSITVDLAPGQHFDIWPHGITLPAGQLLVLTQTAQFNFDTSDFAPTPCFDNDGVIPTVNVTISGATTTYKDVNQILNTGGFDSVCIHNESQPWHNINGVATTINLPVPPAAQLNLMPFNIPGAIQGQSVSVSVSALDGAGNPQVNLPVTLQVFGANAQTQSANTNAAGLATFSYAGNLAGSDTLQASAFVTGFRVISNQGTVVWTPPGGNTNNPLGATITNASPADGSIITKPVAVDATIAPPAGHAITSWRVLYRAAAGGPAVQIGGAFGPPPSPLGVTFDPTVLTNGAYILTVEATADNGAIQDVTSSVQVYGALKLGRYTTSFVDLSVPVGGFQMEVQRTYDSTDKSVGDFGIGWHVGVSNFGVSSNRLLGAGGWSMYNSSCTLGLCLTAYRNAAPRFVSVRYPDGHTEIFDFTPTGGTNVFWSCTPSFTARASVGSTSALLPLDDTACSYTGDGNLYGAHGPYNPQRFRLTTRKGQVLILSTQVGLVSMTDRNGNTLSVDGAGVHYSNGQSIVFTRDGAGRIIGLTGPAGEKTSYLYSASGDLGSSRDVLGGTNTYTYDSAHNLLRIDGPQGAHTSETYDASGRLTSVTDALGHTTQIQNDLGAQTTTYVDAMGTLVSVATADDLGNVVREDISSGGQTFSTQFSYDSTGRLTHKVDPLGRAESAVYDSQGNLVRFTDALGDSIQITYDTNGSPTAVIAPGGAIMSSAVYDNSGNPITLVGAGGAVTNFAYDSAGRPVSKADAAGNVDSISYDSTGRLTSLTDATGKSTTFTYDADNRVTSVSDPLGGVTNLSYDAAGNEMGIVDARGNTASFTYDALGNVTSATDPLGHTATVSYNAQGQMTSVTNRDGGVTHYTYDADNRLSRIDYPDGGFVSYSFDGFGRPVAIANGTATILDTYDAGGQLTATTTEAPPFGSATMTYTYDANGDKLSASGPDGTVGYAYDSLARLTRVMDPDGGVFNLQYDSVSRLVGLTRPNGVADKYAYDTNGKLTGITSTLGVSTVQALSQTSDANGLAVSRTDAAGTTTYAHDADGHLVSVTGPGSLGQAYLYDPDGNRTAGPLSPANTYDAGSELVSDANFNYSYDLEGRRLSKVDRATGATTKYVYNGQGELTGIQFPDGTSTSYAYDPFGRRISTTTGGATTAFAYDGVNARDEFDGSGNRTASYVGTGDVDQPLEMKRGSNAYYYLHGFQRSVSALTDASGSVAAKYSYDAFGIPTGPTTSLTNPFTYTGREFDAKSGLYFDRARYYDPTTGGFTTQDPLGGGGGNPYSYAAADPVDHTDPSGATIPEFLQLVLRSLKWVKEHGQLIGCGLALFGSIFEVGWNVATKSLKFQDVVGLVVGVAAGCVLGFLGSVKNAAAALVLWKLPLAGAIIAAFADILLQAWCQSQGYGTFNPLHPIVIGAAAFVIGAGGGWLGLKLAPESAPAIQKIAEGLGAAVASGNLAGAADVFNFLPSACG